MGLDYTNKVRRAEVSLATSREATGSFDVILHDIESEFLEVDYIWLYGVILSLQ
jgi:hypothetical protein